MKTIEQVQPCLLDTVNLRRSEETPGGVSETVETLKLNSSREAEGKITVGKTN